MSYPGAQRRSSLPRLVAFTSREPAASRRPVGPASALRLLRAGWRIAAQWADSDGSLRLLLAIPHPQTQDDIEMLQAVLGTDESFLEAEQRAELVPGGRRTAEQAIAELTAACGVGTSG
ncbi:hypothetical protein C5B85_10795 [Pseudoclavibacter sp. AY1F1]|uniref:hypothetical protein n=1 Tax=Pseudoclavibacter sp. AY1F1 TaxID=2080583 RepID=UPI000CE87B15|nr:hypothetical protein [Pseudoclavibacter sp. AY1F1]PPF44125.1 hypothetical protein C5B85_10795 [Pseudoclavibacter sp. AY1F1]